MAYKQEPCPLCGRNMTAIETYPGRGELYCSHCDLTIGGNDAKTPEELIALMDSSEHRQLKAENAKLREEIDRLIQAVEDLHDVSLEDRLVQLENENAKLRELILKVEHYECRGCDECPHADSCDAGTLYDEDCAMSSEIEREKRELGVDER